MSDERPLENFPIFEDPALKPTPENSQPYTNQDLLRFARANMRLTDAEMQALAGHVLANQVAIMRSPAWWATIHPYLIGVIDGIRLYEAQQKLDTEPKARVM